MTAEELEAARQERIGADPNELAGSLMDAGQKVVDGLRELGIYWSSMPTAGEGMAFEPPSFSGG
ncbi:MAG TPA: hypothetical protein VMX94_09775 [Armatimonadota bacterium]|nr:hypothetical protein [Armatimonadota bacterium]